MMFRPRALRDRRRCGALPVLCAAAALLCRPAAGPAVAAEAGLVPVEAVVPAALDVDADLALAGTVQARVQSNIAFRVDGKVSERRVEVGQHVAADQVLATVDATEQHANVDNARAAVTAAQALLVQAEATFKRQQSLIASGYTTRASYDQAQETLNTARAQLEAAEAAFNTAEEQLSYAELRAGQDGIVVSRSVEAGQVVQAGQTVFVLAQDGPRDAVFEIPEALLTTPPRDDAVDIALQADPKVTAVGTVREVSPILDAASSTVTVKVGLRGPATGMALGAAVVGRGRFERQTAVVLPWSALFEAEGRPSVWVLDDQDRVSLQPVSVKSYATGSVVLSGGLDGSRRVVTAGVQLLYPGQKVAVVKGNLP